MNGYLDALQIFETINASSQVELVGELIDAAIRYARIRTDYYLLTTKERQEIEEMRTIAHDAFIDSCNILSRNMVKEGEDGTWRKLLGKDRKVIGDFACFLHTILGIRAR